MLYPLSFMTRGTAEVWAHNQMQAIIDGTSLIPTFEAFIKQVKDAFGDPDHSRTALLSDGTRHGVSGEPELDKRDLASTCMLHPLMIRLSQIGGN